LRAWRISLSNFSEFGDFQTPEALAREVIATLPVMNWQRVLEPTCGYGNFLKAAQELGAADSLGIEIQADYAEQAREFAPVINSNIWNLNLATDLPWTTDGPLLVVGNPPWVTSAALGRRGSLNLPKKSNLKSLKGIDALTGSSNFDIAEHIWLKLLVELQEQSPTVSMLCKTQVARNVLTYCYNFDIEIDFVTLHRIDAMKWFGAGVDACLFTVKVGDVPGDYWCDVYDALDSREPSSRMAIHRGQLVSDLRSYKLAEKLDGTSPAEWRQGIKHDAAAVMELTVQEGSVIARDGTPVVVEDAYLYPLMKSTDIFRGRTTNLTKVMVVPQRSLGEDTSLLETTAPLLWSYLIRNRERFDRRKSSIYRNRPPFCIFGVGEYSFSPYKVAISGLHKEPVFRAIGPAEGRPVVLDDTCYFLACESAEHASLVLALLESQPCRALLDSLVFTDSKRPVTKKLLQRIDLLALIELVDWPSVTEAASINLLTLSRSNVDISWRMVKKELVASWHDNLARPKNIRIAAPLPLPLV
jgi:hypothetical protein